MFRSGATSADQNWCCRQAARALSLGQTPDSSIPPGAGCELVQGICREAASFAAESGLQYGCFEAIERRTDVVCDARRPPGFVAPLHSMLSSVRLCRHASVLPVFIAESLPCVESRFEVFTDQHSVRTARVPSRVCPSHPATLSSSPWRRCAVRNSAPLCTRVPGGKCHRKVPIARRHGFPNTTIPASAAEARAVYPRGHLRFSLSHSVSTQRAEELCKLFRYRELSEQPRLRSAR